MDKKEALLSAALELFVSYGFHGTPTSKIAKQAGIATGTLFYFFPTKDDLVKALYVDIKNRMTKYIEDYIRDETSLPAIIRGYYTAPLYWGLEHQRDFQFISQFNNSPYLNEIAAEQIQNHITPFLNILKEGMKNKILKTVDVDMLFFIFSGQTLSIYQYLVSKQFSKLEKKETINKTFDMLWSIIANP